ncbi:Golgi pH regulator [Erysiphe necator]|nr:Golgi pH regulator [Erysiphe necator]
MFLSEKCDKLACSTASHTGSIWSLVLSLIPFIVTFFGLGSLLLYKLFPLISQKTGESLFTVSLPTSPRDSPLLSSRHRSTTSQQKRPNQCRLDALTFATTISLAAVLAELILCEISNALDPVARAYAFKSIIPSLLFSLVFLIPFLEIQSIISASGWSFKNSDSDKTPRVALLLQIFGFSLWLIGFWWLGKGTHIFMISSKSGHGLTAACLERVGIIGIALMALMSGFAAVSAVWHTFGVKTRIVSEADISRKQADLDAINELFVDKQNQLRSLQRKTKDMPTEDYLKKYLGNIRGNSDTQEIQSIEKEISALSYMASSLSSSKVLLQNRLAYSRRASSRLGKTVIMPASFGFSIYCIYRILSTILTNIRILVFSYPSMAAHNSPNTDPINRILSLMAKHIDPTLNRLAWSRQISILLSGFILLASFNSVLTTFHMLTKLSPSLLHQAQANQALLIAQISATYVISSALLLRSNLPNEMKSIVNEALGSPLDPVFVERWFDTWFLLATAGTALGIWTSRRIYGQGVRSWDDAEFEDDLELGQKRL